MVSSASRYSNPLTWLGAFVGVLTAIGMTGCGSQMVASLREGAATLAKATDVEVCHLNGGTATFQQLSLPVSAVAGHTIHGDCVVDDGLDCTIDRCDEILGCVHDPDNSVCDDGNACNGDEVCVVVDGCLPGTPLDCDDGDPCTDDSCDATLSACAHDAVPDCDVVFGDSNQDGVFDFDDLDRLTQWLFGQLPFPPSDSQAFIASDVNGDDVIDFLDVDLYINHLLGIIDRFPVEG